MKWTVVWRPSPTNDLATMWMTSPDRAAMTRAVHRIDTQLRDDPLECRRIEVRERARLVRAPSGGFLRSQRGRSPGNGHRRLVLLTRIAVKGYNDGAPAGL